MSELSDVRDVISRQASLARWAIILLAVAGALNLVAVGSDMSQVSLLRNAVAGLPITDAAVEANDARQQAIGGWQILVLFLSGIVFLRWLHRAYSNLRLVGERSTRFSPGWVVGYWFIPFVNLIRPYQIVKETWQRSEAGNAVESTDGTAAPAIVGLWWGAFVISVGLGRVFANRMDAAEGAAELLSATWWGVASDAVSVGAAALAIMVVRGIDQRQQQIGASFVPTLPSTPSSAEGTTGGDAETVTVLYASVLRRFQAVIADSVVYAAVGLLVVVLGTAAALIAPIGGIFLILWVGFGLLYEPVSVSRFGGTLGHRFNNLRVVSDQTGGNVSFGAAVVRFLIKLFFGWLSFALILFTRRRQALHDLWTLSTVQIRDAETAQPHHFVALPSEQPTKDVAKELPSGEVSDDEWFKRDGGV